MLRTRSGKYHLNKYFVFSKIHSSLAIQYLSLSHFPASESQLSFPNFHLKNKTLFYVEQSHDFQLSFSLIFIERFPVSHRPYSRHPFLCQTSCIILEAKNGVTTLKAQPSSPNAFSLSFITFPVILQRLLIC